MVDLQTLDMAELEQLRDEINRRILQMRRTEGLALPELLRLFEEVKLTLQDQGKTWLSLERWQWMNGGIKFWLNPSEQDIYHAGWFTIDDLIAWVHDTGPVIVAEAAEEANISYKEADGVVIRWLPRGQGGSDTENELRLKLL